MSREFRFQRPWHPGYCALSGLFALSPGCAVAPDHCANYSLACLDVTVQSGPDGVYRLQVNVSDGVDISTTSTMLTPKLPPAQPLVYPLRFGILFGQFSDFYRGQTTVQINALDADYEVIGAAIATVAITGEEKENLSVALSPPVTTPDMANGSPDASTPDASTPDASTIDASTIDAFPMDEARSPDMP
jgi:hypothetical protein